MNAIRRALHTQARRHASVATGTKARPTKGTQSHQEENSGAEKASAQGSSQAGVSLFLDATNTAGARRTGRAWRTSELRLKSFDDLHRLWYILLRERNVLLSERDWCRTNSRFWENGASNLYKVRCSMARVKGVVGERERGLRALNKAHALQREREGTVEGDDEGEEEGDAGKVKE